MNENDLLKDQRGSPAYISPDVLSGKPYAGKRKTKMQIKSLFKYIENTMISFNLQLPTCGL